MTLNQRDSKDVDNLQITNTIECRQVLCCACRNVSLVNKNQSV